MWIVEATRRDRLMTDARTYEAPSIVEVGTVRDMTLAWPDNPGKGHSYGHDKGHVIGIS
jgi:hypothetical protein